MQRSSDTGDYFLSPIPLELGEEYTIYDATGNSSILHYRKHVRKPIFDQTFTYTGEDFQSFTHHIRLNLNSGHRFRKM